MKKSRKTDLALAGNADGRLWMGFGVTGDLLIVFWPTIFRTIPPNFFFPGPSSFILGESEQQKFKMTAQDEFFRHLVISSPIFFGTDVFSCLILSREKNRSGFFFSQVLSEPDLRKEFYQHEASSHRGFSAAEFGSSSKRISSGYLRR